MYELVEKLQAKIKTYKKQVEDAESLASNNLAKYKQLQHQLEDAVSSVHSQDCDPSPISRKNVLIRLRIIWLKSV